MVQRMEAHAARGANRRSKLHVRQLFWVFLTSNFRFRPVFGTHVVRVRTSASLSCNISAGRGSSKRARRESSAASMAYRTHNLTSRKERQGEDVPGSQRETRVGFRLYGEFAIVAPWFEGVGCW